MENVEVLSKKLKRAEDSIKILEEMIESKTRELYLEKSKLEKNSHFVHGIFDTMMSSLIVVDRNLKISMLNYATCRLLGYDKDELLGRAVEELFPFQLNFLWIDEDQFNWEEKYNIEVSYTSKDEQRVPVQISGKPMVSEGGLDHFVLVAMDLRPRKALESQLVQSEKLESIGRLAAGVAHEINTPIQYVLDNQSFIKDSTGDLIGLTEDLVAHAEKTSSDKEGLESILEACELSFIKNEIPSAITSSLDGLRRVKEIVAALKDFSHPTKKEKIVTDINRCIKSTVVVTKNEWKFVADLELKLDEDLPDIPCLPGEFNQVVVNMIVNSSHAISEKKGDEKGKIKIITQHTDSKVLVQIADNGCGIPNEYLSRVFDPFFTTKEVGKGTGQGLSISKDVIEKKLGGKLQVKSEVGKGTVFVIELPIA